MLITFNSKLKKSYFFLSISKFFRNFAGELRAKQNMTNEIVLYQPDATIQLEVRLQDETVWLSQQQMAELFGTDRTSILRHIHNIYKTQELDEMATCAKIAQVRLEGNRQVMREVPFYNLDMIISVGYRVNSIRGTKFRQWANKVIKDYMLKGYAVNQRLLKIENQLATQQKQLSDHQEKIDFFVRTSLPPVEQVFFKGEFFVARVIFEKIVKTATKRVIIIDEYIDAATFEMLDVRAKGVTADIYSSGLHATLRDAHNKTTGLEPIQTHKWRNASHDRWIIADDTLYHCGHSLKDTGNKLSCIDVITSISADVVLNYVR